jgi:hypothetical protein
MYALMALVKRGDSMLQVGAGTAQWVELYTPITWVCEDTMSKCWKAENTNGFDINLCWAAAFDASRYIIPQAVLDYFNGKGKIV